MRCDLQRKGTGYKLDEQKQEFERPGLAKKRKAEGKKDQMKKKTCRRKARIT
jgi:hypothetical protein